MNLEAAIARLVETAPALEPEIVQSLVDDLRAIADPPPAAALATTIARVLELVHAGRVDAGIALPPLAMSIATLVDPRSTARELEAARYEIDTLLPLPTVTRPTLVAPDVAVDALVRKPRT